MSCAQTKFKYNYKYLSNGIMIATSWHNCTYTCINIIVLMLKDNFKWNSEWRFPYLDTGMGWRTYQVGIHLSQAVAYSNLIKMMLFSTKALVLTNLLRIVTKLYNSEQPKTGCPPHVRIKEFTASDLSLYLDPKN